MRMGFDVDGVLYDFTGRFREYVQGQALLSYSEATTWKFYEEWGWEDVDFLFWHKEFVADNQYMHGGLIGGSAETRQAIKKLRDAGHEIILVTARHTTPDQQAEIERQTKAWLAFQGIEYDELHFESDKTKVGYDYFLDDRSENFTALFMVPDMIAYLMDQPWNQDIGGPMNEWRVTSVEEYVEKVLEAEKPVAGVTENGELWGDWTEVGYVDETDTRSKMEILQDSINKTVKGMADAAVTGGLISFDTNESVNVSNEEVRVTNEKTGGQKGSKRARFDLIPSEALWTVAELYGKGAEKYADRNWELGYDWSLSYAALQRHASQFWQGIDNDEETGLPHLASVVFHAFALMTFMKTHPELDNRPGKEIA